MSRLELKPVRRPGTLWFLSAGVIAGLLISAVIHVQLAPGYQQAAPSGLGQGTLFLMQAGAAGLAAALILLRGSRSAFAAAALVALSSLAAVVLYRYVQVPAVGPLPSMYEPVWYASKVITAIAEALAGAFALTGYALLDKQRRASHQLHRDRARSSPS